MAPDVFKSPKQNSLQLFGSFEKSIVSRVLPRVVPYPLGGVQLRPVRRQLENLQVAAVFGEIFIGLLLFVIGGVVLNQINPMTSPIKLWHQDLINKRQVSFPLEIVLLVQIGKLGVVQPDRTEHFLRVPFSASGNLGLTTASSPGGMERGRLPKRGFVLENNHRPFAFGVFFRFG